MKAIKAIFMYWIAGRWLMYAERLEKFPSSGWENHRLALDKARTLLDKADRLWPMRRPHDD